MRVPVTYQMADDAPPPMRWDEYRQIVTQEWERLLASSTDERDFQSFLEQHPSLLPGSFGVVAPGNHGPFPAAVISQPILPAFTRRVPDFLWISFNSVYVYPTLIEIESPGKRWFTRSGEPAADLTQARNQIWEWKEWFANPINQVAFYDYYHLPGYFRQERTLSPQYVLIYGRREEANSTVALSRKRGQMSSPDEHLMTFDRLTPDANASDFMTAKITADGFVAHLVPRTLTLGPALADRRYQIADKEEAVRRSQGIDEQRKAFLIQRLPYWDNWIRNGIVVGSTLAQGLSSE